MAAGIVIAFIPVAVVFIALQKYFVEGSPGRSKVDRGRQNSLVRSRSVRGSQGVVPLGCSGVA
jgi:hypothetical protein